MIKHEEVKDKFIEAEKKLQNMYQLEIKTEVNKLNTEMAKWNQDLFDTFSNKLAEYKSELEKAASQRVDDHDTALDDFKKQLRGWVSTIDVRHNLKYANVSKLTGLLQSVKQGELISANTEAITTNTQSISNNGETITEVKNVFLKQETQLARTKNTVDNLSASKLLQQNDLMI